MRYFFYIFLFLILQSCNPQKMEKLGEGLTTTGKVLEALAPVFNKLDEVIYDFEYDGEMQNGKRHGYGTYIWKDKKFKGTKYVGYHKDNKMHGQGIITFPNGEKYVGRFRYDRYDVRELISIKMELNKRVYGEVDILFIQKNIFKEFK